MKLKRIGYRSIKTVVAVVISFIAADIFPGLSAGMMAAAAITSINISIFNSFRSSYDRIMANVTALIVAFILQISGQSNPLGVAAGMFIIILISYAFNWQYYLGSATIFFVFVLEVPYYETQNLEVYAMNRILDTIIGTVIGLIVNAFLYRPRQEKYLLTIYKKTYMNLREEFHDLIEEDKAVDEFKLIDNISSINESYKNLRNDIKLKMNSNVNTVTVSKLNNLFRMALSLIIELNDIEERPKISRENEELLLHFFKGEYSYKKDIIKEDEIDKEFYFRYNYEIKKLINTLESIEYNIAEFTNMYNRLDNVWYKETKDMDDINNLKH